MILTLISPPDDNLENAGDRPPLGILYVAAYVREQLPDVEVRFFDLNHDTEIDAILSARESDITGFTAVTPSYHHCKRMATELQGHTMTVLGGNHASAMGENVWHAFDIVIVGEGERAMVDLCRQVIDGENTLAVPVEAALPLTEDELDNLEPARDLIDMSKYGIGGTQHTLITSRGCPGHCAYCGHQVFGHTWRGRSPDAVFWEVSHMAMEYGVRDFYFLDDCFTKDKARLAGICTQIGPLGIKFRCTTRADYVDDEVAAGLAAAGCKVASMGIESVNDAVLKGCGKGQTIEQIQDALASLKMADIQTKGFFIVGLPGQTEDDVLDALSWSKAWVDSADWYPMTVYPGSPIWKKPKSFGMTYTKDFSASQVGTMSNASNGILSREDIGRLVEKCRNVGR